MKEIRDILNKIAELRADEGAVLATVVDLRGSGYRLPGARMLVLGDERTIGTVSGGCLEADVLERAKRVRTTGKPEVFSYDTTGDEASVFSMNMGCRGVIRILLESAERDSLLLERLRWASEKRETQFITTLISGDAGVGGRAFLNESLGYEVYGLPPYFVDSPELSDALDQFAASGEEYEIKTFATPTGTFEFAFERISPPVRMLLFGAGADAIPLSRLANEIGWVVTVYDHRPAYLTRERFAGASDLVLRRPDEPLGPPAADRRTAAVLMTHNYSRDLEALPALLASGVFYVGVLGPRARTRELLDEIAENGQTFSPEQLARLYAPVGLDIGGDTPEGIALAIVAEIQSVLRSRPAGHLREREGSIYDRN